MGGPDQVHGHQAAPVRKCGTGRSSVGVCRLCQGGVPFVDGDAWGSIARTSSALVAGVIAADSTRAFSPDGIPLRSRDTWSGGDVRVGGQADPGGDRQPWDEEFLTGLNDALSTMDTGGALRERIVKLVDREVASRQRARQRPDRQAEVNKPLRKMALDSATLGAWLMDSVPDDRHAWALLLEMTTVDVDDYSNQRTLRQVVDAVNGVVTT